MAEHAHNIYPPITVTRRALALARGAFAAVGLTAGAAASMPEPSADAALIRLCAQFDALERRYQALCEAARTIKEEHRNDPALEAMVVPQGPIVGRICALPVCTGAGLRAVAASLMLWDGEIDLEDDQHADTNDRLLSAMMRGVLREGWANV